MSFAVDRLVACRQNLGQDEYLVAWEGGKSRWGSAYQTWEPAAHIPLRLRTAFQNKGTMFAVKQIIDKRISRGRTQYRVVFQGCPRNGAQWVSETDLSPELCRSLVPKSDSYRCSDPATKQWLNEIFATACTPWATEGQCLVLDAADFQTSRALEKQGFASDRIHVPSEQYFLSFPDHCQVYPMRSTELAAVLLLEGIRFSSIWFDYNGTGICKNSSPYDELRDLLESQQLNSNGILAYTFCTRTWGPKVTISLCQDWVQGLLLEFGFSYQPCFSHVYSQSREVFLLWSFEKAL